MTAPSEPTVVALRSRRAGMQRGVKVTTSHASQGARVPTSFEDPIARIFVVVAGVVMGCAYPEFWPKRQKTSIRPAERACLIYLLHNVRCLVAQSLLLKQTVASSQASTDPEVLLSASKSTEPGGLEGHDDRNRQSTASRR